jgi:hypothetical protein
LVTGLERDRVQLQRFSSRRAHHLKEDSSIWIEEKDLKERDFWVSFVCHRASFLVYFRGVLSAILFTKAWHELEKRGVHFRKWFQPFGGSDLHYFA